MRTIVDLTAEEKKALRNWVAYGNSVYENPYEICDEHGMTMDYIKAIRCYDETSFRELMDAQNVDYEHEESMDMDVEPFYGDSSQTNISTYAKHNTSLCKSTFHTSWLNDISLHNGNGVAFSIKTQVNRQDAITGIILYLTYIRDAEKRDLDNTPEVMQDSDVFESGEYAVDAIEEIIDLLEDVY
jgi:hypothetical protein